MRGLPHVYIYMSHTDPVDSMEKIQMPILRMTEIGHEIGFQ